MYPSEYAYHKDSVYSTERDSANCKNYPQSLSFNARSQDYIHCDGTPLRLTDSDLGSEQYTRSDYYMYAWLNETRNHQLLFIFPTKVNLTTITLHYYSNSIRGLLRQRFWAVPDDFDVWDAPLSSYSYVDAPVPSGGESAHAGQKNVSFDIHVNTRKVLLVKFSSAFSIALSEVQFLFYEASDQSNIAMEILDTTKTEPITQRLSTTDYIYHASASRPNNTVTISLLTNNKGTAVTTSMTATVSPSQYYDNTEMGSLNLNLTNTREAIAWTVAAVSIVLFVVSLTVNITMLRLRYKKRQAKDNNVEAPMFEMEGNPCYEAASMKQTTDSTGVQEVHLYESVNQNKTK